MLHTKYQNRKRIFSGNIVLTDGKSEKIKISVCVGTSCYQKGAQKLMHELIDYVQRNNLEDSVNIVATFCYENCSDGPTVSIGEMLIKNCTLRKVQQTLKEQMKSIVMK